MAEIRHLGCWRQNAKTRFSGKLSNLVNCNWAFKEQIIRSLKSNMAEIRHLENRHDVIFSAEGGPIWIKFRRLMQNDMSTAVMWSKSKPDVEFHYGGCLGEFNGMSSRATCHTAGCCHRANSMASSRSVAVSSQRRRPRGLLGQEERPHHPITPGPSLAARPGARQVQVMCVGLYRCLHGMAPSYLADDLQLTSTVGTRRQLRSADSPTLVVRSTRRSTLGDRAFPVAAARAWNSLPPAVREPLEDMAVWTDTGVTLTSFSGCTSFRLRF